jgi:hypothetical protein
LAAHAVGLLYHFNIPEVSIANTDFVSSPLLTLTANSRLSVS